LAITSRWTGAPIQRARRRRGKDTLQACAIAPRRAGAPIATPRREAASAIASRSRAPRSREGDAMFEAKSGVWFLIVSCGWLAGCTDESTKQQSPPETASATSAASAEAIDSAARADLIDSGSRADSVFVGEVTRIAHQVSSPDASGLRLPFTLVTWRVDDGIKGVAGQTYTARFLGGPLGDRTLDVPEIPTFAVGDRDLLFVRDNGSVGCPLVDGARGRVRITGATRPDGLSPDAPSGAWLGAAVASLHAANLGPSRAAPDLDAPFVFAWPRSATTAERLAAARAARARISAAVAGGAHAPTAERAAYEANGNNPVLPK
jgi:hypothetical protein